MGLLDNIGNKLSSMSDDDKRGMALGLASGFAGMSGNPNSASIMAGISDQQKALAARREKASLNQQASQQNNRTAQMLIGKGGKYAEIGQALLLRQIDGKQAMAMHDTIAGKKIDETFSIVPVAEVRAAGLDPSMVYQRNSLSKKISPVVSGGGTSVDVKNIIGGEGDANAASLELFKGVGKGGSDTVNAFANDYEPALKTLNSIDTLQRLGDIMETTTSIPSWARGFVPEGVSGSINAYDAVVKSVAQGMRVAGSGPMTENDFKVLLQRAGSSSLDKDARMVIHAGLRAAAQRRVDLGAAAQAFQLNPNQANLAVYQETIKEIRNRPLFTEEERNYLESFGPKVDSSSIDQTYQTYFGQLTPARQARFSQMTPATQKKFYESWLAGKTQ